MTHAHAVPPCKVRVFWRFLRGEFTSLPSAAFVMIFGSLGGGGGGRERADKDPRPVSMTQARAIGCFRQLRTTVKVHVALMFTIVSIIFTRWNVYGYSCTKEKKRLLLFNFNENYCYYYYTASITLYIVTIYLNNIWNFNKIVRFWSFGSIKFTLKTGLIFCIDLSISLIVVCYSSLS